MSRRAYSYAMQDGAYRNAVLSYANHGATSLFTTAPDLALWLDNLRHHRVGGPELVGRMSTRYVLTGGDTISYALGVGHGSYRGARTLGHGGSDAGFRSNVTWFPDHRTGIVVLSNLASGDPGTRALRVADVVLGDVLGPMPERDDSGPPETVVPVPLEGAEPYLGSYYGPEVETVYEIRGTVEGLVAYHLRHGDIPLEYRGDDVFRGDRWFFREVRFTRDASGRVDGFRLGGGRVRNLRFVRLEGPLPGR